MSKWEILKMSIVTGFSIAKQVFTGLSNITDWEHFQAFKVEHTIGVEERE